MSWQRTSQLGIIRLFYITLIGVNLKRFYFQITSYSIRSQSFLAVYTKTPLFSLSLFYQGYSL